MGSNSLPLGVVARAGAGGGRPTPRLSASLSSPSGCSRLGGDDTTRAIQVRPERPAKVPEPRRATPVPRQAAGSPRPVAAVISDRAAPHHPDPTKTFPSSSYPAYRPCLRNPPTDAAPQHQGDQGRASAVLGRRHHRAREHSDGPPQMMPAHPTRQRPTDRPRNVRLRHIPS